MKSIKKIIVTLAFIAVSAFITQEKAQAQGTMSFQLFYDQLSPYGQWVNYPQYGYVWMPGGVQGFSPYETAGHWVLTDFGWTWVSDYPWGWAPFHYGRWHYDSFYGWLWVPGNEWAPAWVSWRRAPGYYGWAPLGPGVSMQVAFGPRYHVPHERWIFVQERYISNPHLNDYYAPRTDNGTIIQNSTVINNTYTDNGHHATYISGPRRDDVQKVTGAQIQPVKIKDSGRPSQSLNNNELNIYRPAVQANYPGGSKPEPRKVANLKDIKPASAADVNNSPPGRPVEQPSKADMDKNIQKDQQPVQSKPAPSKSNPSPVNQQQEPAHVNPQKNNSTTPPVKHNQQKNVNPPHEAPHHNSPKEHKQNKPK